MELSEGQKETLGAYADLLAHFNKRINLISPNTVSSIWSTHIEHSLVLAHAAFPNGARVVDWGTGGGLPLIPMAVCFPEVEFVGVDAVGKKIACVRAMSRKLGLANVDVWHGRAEAWDGSTHYSISRATAPLETLWAWHARAVVPFAGTPLPETCWSPGLVCLKGGDLREESAALTATFPDVKINSLSVDKLIPSPLFLSKYILHIFSGTSL